MPRSLPKCLRCGGEMEQGYIPDRVSGWYDPTKWFAGELVRGMLGGVKRAKSKPLVVRTYRCPQCGYLESYAEKPKA
jgi:hypothetical protein